MGVQQIVMQQMGVQQIVMQQMCVQQVCSRGRAASLEEEVHPFVQVIHNHIVTKFLFEPDPHPIQTIAYSQPSQTTYIHHSTYKHYTDRAHQAIGTKQSEQAVRTSTPTSWNQAVRASRASHHLISALPYSSGSHTPSPFKSASPHSEAYSSCSAGSSLRESESENQHENISWS